MSKLPVMAHLVLGYPSLEESLRTAERYIGAGMAILELQIPFSHPTADGPVITEACQKAVAQGITTADCLRALERLRSRYPEQEIIVMSYLNPVFVFGFEKFRTRLAALGIRHLIIPDLPALADGAPAGPLGSPIAGSPALVPVLAGNTSGQRLEALLAAGCDFFYLMSDFKITGSTFGLHPRLQSMVGQIRAAGPGRRAGIGFGIETPEQIRAVLEVADYAIVGSALIRAQQAGQLDVYLESLRKALPAKTPAP
ncbi:MAG: tryptophan synthase subunit alpha [Saprospiraceae bacterium]|nr:tryptophan synthase subunit alpha [Saprospiraceae bacterium]